MRKFIGLSLTIALGLTALAAVPAAANNDKGSDVERGIPCGWSEGGVIGSATDVHLRWKGDTSYLMCKFKGLDMTLWDGVKYVEGTGCNIEANPDSPYQSWLSDDTDYTWRVNAAGNATLRCVGTQPS